MQCNKTSISAAKYSISFLLSEKKTQLHSQKDNKTSISAGYNLLIYLFICLTLQHRYTIYRAIITIQIIQKK